MARPPIDPKKKKTDAVQLRLSVADRVVFDQLVAARLAELGPGAELSDAGLLRWLFWKEATARGLAPVQELPRSPQPTNPKPKKIRKA